MTPCPAGIDICVPRAEQHPEPRYCLCGPVLLAGVGSSREQAMEGAEAA